MKKRLAHFFGTFFILVAFCFPYSVAAKNFNFSATINSQSAINLSGSGGARLRAGLTYRLQWAATDKSDAQDYQRFAIACYSVSGYQGTELATYGPFFGTEQVSDNSIWGNWRVPIYSNTYENIPGNPRNCFCRLRVYYQGDYNQLAGESSEFQICDSGDIPLVLPYIETLQAQVSANGDTVLNASLLGNGNDPYDPDIWWEIFPKNSFQREPQRNPLAIKIQPESDKLSWARPNVSFTVTNFAMGQGNYCYQALAKNRKGIWPGKAFCNVAGQQYSINKPMAQTMEPSAISKTSATLNVAALSAGGDPNGAELWFFYYEASNKQNTFTTVNDRKKFLSKVDFSVPVQGLKPCTNYCYYVYVHNDWGYYLDKPNEKCFVTLGDASCQKWVETVKFVLFDQNKTAAGQDISYKYDVSPPLLWAKMTGRLFRFGGEEGEQKGQAYFYWDTIANYKREGKLANIFPKELITKTIDPTKEPNGQYFYDYLPIEYLQGYCWQAAVKNSAGVEKLSQEKPVCMDPISPLEAHAVSAEAVKIDESVLTGEIVGSGGNYGAIKAWFEYWPCENESKQPEPQDIKTTEAEMSEIYYYQQLSNPLIKKVTYSQSIAGLQEGGTKYCFRSIAQNSENVVYRSKVVKTFNTLRLPRVVTCRYVTLRDQKPQPLCNLNTSNLHDTWATLAMSLDPLIIKDSSLKTWFKVWEAREKDRPGDTSCDIEPKPGESNVWNKVSYQEGAKQSALVFGQVNGLKTDTTYCVRAYAQNAGGFMQGQWESFDTTYNAPLIDVDYFKTENILKSSNPKKKNNFSYRLTGKVLSDGGGVRGDGINITVYWWVDGELPSNTIDPRKTDFFKNNKNTHRIEFSDMRYLVGDNFDIIIGHDNMVAGKKYYAAVVAQSLGTQGFKQSSFIIRSFISSGPEMGTLDIFNMPWGKALMRGTVKVLGNASKRQYYFRICSPMPGAKDTGTRQDSDFACSEFDAQAREIFVNPDSNGGIFYYNIFVPEMREHQKVVSQRFIKNLDAADRFSIESLPENIGKYMYEAQACIRTDCLNNGKFDCRSCSPIKPFVTLSDSPFYSQKHGDYTSCKRKGSLDVFAWGCGDSALSMDLAYWYQNDSNFRANWQKAYASIMSCAEPMGCDDNHIKGIDKKGQLVPLDQIPDKDLSTDDIFRKYRPTTYKVLRYLTCRGLFSSDWVMTSKENQTTNSIEKEFRKLGLYWLPITGNAAIHRSYPWFPKNDFVNWSQTHLFTRIGIPVLLRCNSGAKTGTHYLELLRWDNTIGREGYVSAILNDSGSSGACSTGRLTTPILANSKDKLASGCGVSQADSENRGDQTYAIFPLYMMPEVEKFYNFYKPGTDPGFKPGF